ncbi:MAG: hopanoid biosynthesis-associated protein HpnK [Stellaceae bacterium]
MFPVSAQPRDGELRSLIVCADDFGLDPAVNEAVEEAHRRGILSSASLMVGAPAAADAVSRARRLPDLRVGLHLVVVDGHPTLPCAEIRGLVRRDGRFDPNMGRAGVRFFALPQVRRQLAMEIRAQFEAFHTTGLRLDHVNAHKHMHVHPTVARVIIEIGRDYGMTAVRLPFEPVEPLHAAFPDEHHSAPLYRPWIEWLRRRLQSAGLFVNDNLFGLAWTGGMVEVRLLRLLPQLPQGVSEIYFHPATVRSGALRATMPGYRHEEELAALLSPSAKSLVAELGISLGGYSDFATGAGTKCPCGR